MANTPRLPPPAPDEEERVPLFGSWRAIHTAVIVWALVVMGLLVVVSRWPF